MSLGISTQNFTATINEIALFTADVEEALLPENQAGKDPSEGNLKGSCKQYRAIFSSNESTFVPKEGKTANKLFHAHFPQSAKNGLSPMQLVATGRQIPMKKEELFSLKPEMKNSTKECLNKNDSKFLNRTPIQTSPQSNTPLFSHQLVHKGGLQQLHKQTMRERSNEKREASSTSMREWKKEETKQWWQLRYDQQKEREQDGQKREQQNQQEKEKTQINKQAANGKLNTLLSSSENLPASSFKPTLKAPSVGVFALYYILTKIGIFSDGTSNFAYRKEIEVVDTEATDLHIKRLEQLKEAVKKEKETTSWGIVVKVFSWIASLFNIIAGALLIASGVGAIAGAMLVSGGVIQLSSQIMELTGGWKKIVQLLPGDDDEKKRAIISWMQIGIGVLCLILSGAGIVWGGYGHFGESMSIASSMIGAIAALGTGISTIGAGLSESFYKDHMGNIKKFELELAKLRHKRKDLMEKVELGVDRLEQLFEDLARFLSFEEELFQADQMINRRS